MSEDHVDSVNAYTDYIAGRADCLSGVTPVSDDLPELKPLLDFMQQSPPRIITDEISGYIRNPLAKVICYFFPLIVLVTMVLDFFIFYNVWAIPQEQQSFISYIAPLIVLSQSFLMLYVSFRAYSMIQRYRGNFSDGFIYDAYIKSVKHANANIGWRVYYKVTVELEFNGVTVTCKDYVDNRIVENFRRLHEKGETVRALYAPNSFKRCALLDKLVLEYKPR